MRYGVDEYHPQTVIGKSDVAVIVGHKLEKISLERNISLTQATRDAKLSRLLNSLLADEFSREDWDGYSAKPVKSNAIGNLYFMLDNIPKHIPLPEVMVEPTGDVGMDWKTNKGELAASVDEDGVLSFACLSEKGEETFGSGKIDGKFLPKNFMEILNSIF